jgi:hypothetical protein
MHRAMNIDLPIVSCKPFYTTERPRAFEKGAEGNTWTYEGASKRRKEKINNDEFHNTLYSENSIIIVI